MCFSLSLASDIYVSRGSLAIRLECGGIVRYRKNFENRSTFGNRWSIGKSRGSCFSCFFSHCGV